MLHRILDRGGAGGPPEAAAALDRLKLRRSNREPTRHSVQLPLQALKSRRLLLELSSVFIDMLLVPALCLLQRNACGASLPSAARSRRSVVACSQPTARRRTL